MKEIKKKGVATSLFPSATCWPLASLVSRRHVFSVGTRPPSARVLRRHVFSVNHLTLFWRRFSSPSTRTQTPTCALGAPCSLSSHTHGLSALRPLLAHRIRLSANREKDTPPSLSFPRHRDRSFFICTWRIRCGFSFLHPTTVKPSFLLCREFWRETPADCEPRHGLRGEMLRHGACSLAGVVVMVYVVVGEVAS